MHIKLYFIFYSFMHLYDSHNCFILVSDTTVYILIPRSGGRLNGESTSWDFIYISLYVE